MQNIIFTPNVFTPEDAAALREATALAIKAVGGADRLGEVGRDALANCVVKLAQRGYSRASNGSFNPISIAEAAVLRFKDLSSAENREP